MKSKKKIYKRWWFWVIIVVLVLGALGSGGGDNSDVANEVGTNTDTNISSDATVDDDVDAEADTNADTNTNANANANTNANNDASVPSFILTAGELGEYGKEIVMSEGTDMEEHLIVYYVPAGDYTVTNIGQYMTQVNVYGGFAPDETGYDNYTEVGDIVLLEVMQSATITVPEGWYIEIHEPTKIRLTPKQ